MAIILRPESILSGVEGLRTDSEQLTYLLFLKIADEWTNCGKNGSAGN